jgi:hypothetical protein
VEDKMLPQLFVHTINETLAKAFVKKLANEESNKNRKMDLAPIMLKKNLIILV